MYYVIERCYAGVNTDQNVNADTVQIWSEPPSDQELRCVIGDWSTHLWGEFETIKEARKHIKENFETRESDEHADLCCRGVLAVYLLGEYEEMTRDATADWIYAALEESISADSDDDDIDAFIEEMESFANREGYTLSIYARDDVEKYRDDLILERE